MASHPSGAARRSGSPPRPLAVQDSCDDAQQCDVAAPRDADQAAKRARRRAGRRQPHRQIERQHAAPTAAGADQQAARDGARQQPDPVIDQIRPTRAGLVGVRANGAASATTKPRGREASATRHSQDERLTPARRDPLRPTRRGSTSWVRQESRQA